MLAIDQPQTDYFDELIPGPCIDVEIEDFIGFILTPIRGSNEHDTVLEFELSMNTSSLWELYDTLIRELPDSQQFDSYIAGIYTHGPIPETLSIDRNYGVDIVVDQHDESVYERRTASYLVQLANTHHPLRRNFRGHIEVSLQVKDLQLDFRNVNPVLNWSQMIVRPVLKELTKGEISLAEGQTIRRHTGIYEFEW